MCKTFIVADADHDKSLFKYRSQSPFICRAHALTIGVSDDRKEIVMGKRDMRKEIAEAVTASDRALKSLEEAGLYLSKAAGWGVWDLPGGGMFGTFMKHSRMDDASRAMEAAKSHLRRLKRELLDVELPGEFKLDVGDFLTFADYFFDGIIADWMVQTRIKDAEAQVEEAKQRVTRIRSRLYELKAELPPEKGGNA